MTKGVTWYVCQKAILPNRKIPVLTEFVCLFKLIYSTPLSFCNPLHLRHLFSLNYMKINATQQMLITSHRKPATPIVCHPLSINRIYVNLAFLPNNVNRHHLAAIYLEAVYCLWRVNFYSQNCGSKSQVFSELPTIQLLWFFLSSLLTPSTSLSPLPQFS